MGADDNTPTPARTRGAAAPQLGTQTRLVPGLSHAAPHLLPRDPRCGATAPELGPRPTSDRVHWIRRPHLGRDVMTGSSQGPGASPTASHRRSSAGSTGSPIGLEAECRVLTFSPLKPGQALASTNFQHTPATQQQICSFRRTLQAAWTRFPRPPVRSHPTEYLR